MRGLSVLLFFLGFLLWYTRRGPVAANMAASQLRMPVDGDLVDAKCTSGRMATLLFAMYYTQPRHIYAVHGGSWDGAGTLHTVFGEVTYKVPDCSVVLWRDKSIVNRGDPIGFIVIGDRVRMDCPLYNVEIREGREGVLGEIIQAWV